MIEIVPATQEHIAYIAPRLRAADLAEIAASTPLTPAEALKFSMEGSVLVWTALADGRPICMFGVAGACTSAGVGSPWMLGTDEIRRHPFGQRHGKAVLAAMLRLFPHLENHVDVRNKAAVAWLRWLGFTIHPARPHGPFGRPFHPFEMRC